MERNQPSLQVKSATAHSFTPSEKLTLDWRIDNFKDMVDIAVQKKRDVIATLPFEMGSSFPLGITSHTLSFSWTVEISQKPSTKTKVDNTNKTSIGLFLESNQENKSHASVWPNLYFRYGINIVLNDLVIKTLSSGKSLLNFEKVPGWGFREIFNMTNADTYLNNSGTLTFKLIIFVYYQNQEPSLVKNTDVESEKLAAECQIELLKDVASLFIEDKHRESCDMKILVQDLNKETELSCHSAILSARSPVFQAMFLQKDMIEKEEGVVKINDVSAEAMGQFLAFLYTGDIKDKHALNKTDSFWVKLLPELAYLADKYEVKTLMDFCDANFHLNVTQENAAEMLVLAKRHRLLKAEEKLRSIFSK